MIRSITHIFVLLLLVASEVSFVMAVRRLSIVHWDARPSGSRFGDGLTGKSILREMESKDLSLRLFDVDTLGELKPVGDSPSEGHGSPNTNNVNENKQNRPSNCGTTDGGILCQSKPEGSSSGDGH